MSKKPLKMAKIDQISVRVFRMTFIKSLRNSSQLFQSLSIKFSELVHNRIFPIRFLIWTRKNWRPKSKNPQWTFGIRPHIFFPSKYFMENIEKPRRSSELNKIRQSGGTLAQLLGGHNADTRQTKGGNEEDNKQKVPHQNRRKLTINYS